MSAVPFYANPDNNHCFQCCFRMVLEYFQPERQHSWEELDRLTGKRHGLWTWRLFGLAALSDLGFEVINLEEFDHRRFVSEGETYLIEYYGDKAAQEMIANSDIPFEIETTKRLHDRFDPPALPQYEDIVRLVSQGYLVICLVNSKKLNDQPGYTGHFLLVYSADQEQLELHDPGPPGKAGRIVKRQQFINAWQLTDERDQSLIAIRKKGGKGTLPF